MMNMKVQMDEKKIKKSGEYSVEQINNMVIEAARRRGITKRNDRGLFFGNGDDKDFSNFGLIVLYLADQEWFLPFVKTWVLYTDDGKEDMAKHYRESNKQGMPLEPEKRHEHKSVMKMKVYMNKRKIEKSGEYSVEQINNMVIEAARRRGITKRNDRGLFLGNGDNKDFSNFGLIVLYLADQEWFLPFVKTWVLYDGDEVDDLAKYYKEKKGID